ncbi:MAG: hypothetical protein J4N89_15185 [Chloroflexi bacterium]|nr:hypothetical protein [Chloroflexota bacterium]
MFHRLIHSRRLLIIFAGLALFAVACSSAAPVPTFTPRPTATSAPVPTPTLAPANTPAPAPTEIPTQIQTEIPTKAPSVAPTQGPAAEATAIGGSGIEGGDPEFNAAALIWQGYWLSRNHFGPFVMASGMGIPFMPPMEMMQNAMKMVAQNPDDPLQIPQNMLPLQAVFASGSTSLVNDPRDFGPLDLEGFRLDPATFDKTIKVRAQGETMLKLTQWAHNFSNQHFGKPTDDFGALQRFLGVMVAMLSQMQGQYAMQNLLNMDDGLYRDSDGTLDYTGNWVMLHTLSDVSVLTGEGSRYANPDSHPMFEEAATGLFQALKDRDPETPVEAAAAIRALVYRSWTAEDSAIADAAMAQARSIADGALVGFASDDVVEQAAAIVGLVSVGVAAKEDRYLDASDTLFQTLSGDFDPVHGIFNSKNVYNVDDVAWIIGGLNYLVQRGNAGTRSPAADMLLAFYEATISQGGMQLSAPPGKNGVMAGEFEKDLPSVVYYHPADTPPPPMVMKLPVPAEEITWDGSTWSVTSDRLVTAGAMHLANELNWLGPHLGSIPFPPIGLSGS